MWKSTYEWSSHFNEGTWGIEVGTDVASWCHGMWARSRLKTPSVQMTSWDWEMKPWSRIGFGCLFIFFHSLENPGDVVDLGSTAWIVTWKLLTGRHVYYLMQQYKRCLDVQLGHSKKKTNHWWGQKSIQAAYRGRLTPVARCRNASLQELWICDGILHVKWMEARGSVS